LYLFNLVVKKTAAAREGMHSPFFWRRNPTKTLGFLLPWFSPWFFVGFLLSPPPYAQSFLRKPSFLVLADFFPWFFKSKQLLGWSCLHAAIRTKWKYYFLFISFQSLHSKKDI
jgi:hypothetical protein